jgi:hypothetical protein
MTHRFLLTMLAVSGLAAAVLAGAALDTRTLTSSPVAGVSAASHPRTDPPGAHPPKTEKTPEPAESAEPAEPAEPADAPDTGATKAAHPCNHGFYVAQAAHAHKGGQYVSSIAKSELGKNGDCSAPLPAPKT